MGIFRAFEILLTRTPLGISYRRSVGSSFMGPYTVHVHPAAAELTYLITSYAEHAGHFTGVHFQVWSLRRGPATPKLVTLVGTHTHHLLP